MERIRDSMKQASLFDGRNIYDPDLMYKLGFKYRGVGRGYNGARLDRQSEHEFVASPTAQAEL